MSNKKRLIVIDSNSLIHRAFHALPLLTTPKGEIINAVYGFLLVFLKAIKEFNPDFIAACFDLPGPTFRHKMFKEYKGKRKKAPNELYNQIPRIKEILRNFNVPIFEKQGFEADDLIATISAKVQEKQVATEIETIILSGDLDTFQFIDKNTNVCTLGKGIKETVIYDEGKVKDRFGVSPKQVVDYKALAGDSADNIPGAEGIGKKTAETLLREYGSLENLYKAIESGEAWDLKSRIKDILIKNKEQVFLSQTLARAERNVPIDFSLEKCEWKKYDKKKMEQIFKDLNFLTLINRLPL